MCAWQLWILMDERTEKGPGLDVWAEGWEQDSSRTTEISLFSALGIQAPTRTRAVAEELTPTFPLSSQQPCQVGVEAEGCLRWAVQLAWCPTFES